MDRETFAGSAERRGADGATERPELADVVVAPEGALRIDEMLLERCGSSHPLLCGRSAGIPLILGERGLSEDLFGPCLEEPVAILAAARGGNRGRV